MNGEKVIGKVHKDTAYCLEQILDAATDKTAAVRTFTSHLTNPQNKTSKTC